MDSFEFVQVPVAIVLGFGISEILAGWGHQLRHRREQPISGLQLLASSYVLMMSFRYLWVQWSLRPEVWDYPAYMLSVAPAVIIALAAHSIRFDPGTRQQTGPSSYERSRQPVCWLLALLPLFQMARVVYIIGPDPTPSDPVAVMVPIGLLFNCLVFARLALTDRILEQWIGWCLCWTGLLIFLALINPNLTPVIP